MKRANGRFSGVVAVLVMRTSFSLVIWHRFLAACSRSGCCRFFFSSTEKFDRDQKRETNWQQNYNKYFWGEHFWFLGIIVKVGSRISFFSKPSCQLASFVLSGAGQAYDNFYDYYYFLIRCALRFFLCGF